MVGSVYSASLPWTMCCPGMASGPAGLLATYSACGRLIEEIVG
jgi:hypothetical protein